MNLRETNTKKLEKHLLECPEIREFREGMKAKHGFDPMTDTEKFPVMKEGFSWKKLESKLREADAAGSFQQFLRAGVQAITNGMYMATPTTFEDWVTVVPSSKDTELYAPMHGIAFPSEVGPSQVYPEVGAAALDMQLKNRKFGSIYAIERELLNDDQVGVFQQQAGMLGQYMKILQEVWVYGKLASESAMSYQALSIPVSETKPSYETNYPWSTALRGGGANRPAAYAALGQAAIQNAFIALANQKNLQGIKMSVAPSRILASFKYRFDLAVLLNSGYYPSGAAAAGATGGAFAINPIQGIADVSYSRYMFSNAGTPSADSKAWYLIDDSKPWFVMQVREGVTVETEAPNAGESFNRDHVRFKARSRFNADHIDPRFAWKGSDGSI